MTRTTWVIHNSSGTILRAHRGDDETTPQTGTGETAVDVGDVPVPRQRTHTMSGGTVTEKPPLDIAAESDARRKAELERSIGLADACRDAMATRLYDTAALDAEIADMVAERDGL